MIGIVDASLGNLRSVQNAIHLLGEDTCFIREPMPMNELTHLILPGVGAYAAAMEKLQQKKLAEWIRDFHVSEKKPILGICLGMQLLSTSGEEGGDGLTAGLDLIPGCVKKFKGSYPLPHVGWNNVSFTQKKHPLLKRIKPDRDFYFVHSYYFDCEEKYILANATYEIEFPAIVGNGNVVGAQFHPEKSQNNGLQLLENFLQMK